VPVRAWRIEDHGSTKPSDNLCTSAEGARKLTQSRALKVGHSAITLLVRKIINDFVAFLNTMRNGKPLPKKEQTQKKGEKKAGYDSVRNQQPGGFFRKGVVLL